MARSLLLHDVPRRWELTAKLNTGKRGCSYDEAGVVQALRSWPSRRDQLRPQMTVIPAKRGLSEAESVNLNEALSRVSY